MISTNMIKGRITEKGLTQLRVAELLGINENTLGAKINGKREFTVSEIERLSEILSIEDKTPFFFASE